MPAAVGARIAALSAQPTAVAAGSRVLAQDGRKSADALIDVAQKDGADLIVAGAYGQSRLGEWVFGGVTRDLLSACPVCCLLAH